MDSRIDVIRCCFYEFAEAFMGEMTSEIESPVSYSWGYLSAQKKNK